MPKDELIEREKQVVVAVAKAIARRNGATLDAMRMSNRNKYYRLAEAAIEEYERAIERGEAGR